MSDRTRPFCLSEASTGRSAPRRRSAPSARRGPAAPLRLRAAQKQLGHHGRFDLVDAEPLVEVMSKADSAAPLHFGHRSHLAQPGQRFLDILQTPGPSSESDCSLIATRPQRVERHRIPVGRRLGFFNQHAQHATVDAGRGLQRLGLASATDEVGSDIARGAPEPHEIMCESRNVSLQGPARKRTSSSP